MKRIRIGNAEIDPVTMEEAFAEIERLTRDSQSSMIITPNADHIVRLEKNEEFRKIYMSAALVLADGMPLIWASRLLGTPLPAKVSGSDLFTYICSRAANTGLRLFFLGGREGAAVSAAARMRRIYEGLEIVGTHCPPFGFEHDEEEKRQILTAIETAQPDILFVGLGSPKQEKWIYENRQNHKVPVCIGVGVTFEFAANMVRRAPACLQRIGMEWFWRLLMEPRRLWKRYLIDDMKFFQIVFRQLLRKRRSR